MIHFGCIQHFIYDQTIIFAYAHPKVTTLTSSMTSSVVTPDRDRDVISWVRVSFRLFCWTWQLSHRIWTFLEGGGAKKQPKILKGGPNCQNLAPNGFKRGFYSSTLIGQKRGRSLCIWEGGWAKKKCQKKKFPGIRTPFIIPIPRSRILN